MARGTWYVARGTCVCITFRGSEQIPSPHIMDKKTSDEQVQKLRGCLINAHSKDSDLQLSALTEMRKLSCGLRHIDGGEEL